MIEHACAILLVIMMIVNEFIITIGFGGRGTRSIRGRVLFCSNNAAVRGLIEGVYYSAQITQRCAV